MILLFFNSSIPDVTSNDNGRSPYSGHDRVIYQDVSSDDTCNSLEDDSDFDEDYKPGKVKFACYISATHTPNRCGD